VASPSRPPTAIGVATSMRGALGFTGGERTGMDREMEISSKGSRGARTHDGSLAQPARRARLRSRPRVERSLQVVTSSAFAARPVYS
jgi:hypothetical protein